MADHQREMSPGSPPPVRRVPVQPVKRRRRKRNMSLYYIMVFLIVVAAVIFLSLFVFFKIDEIKISGTDLYSRDQIIAACGIREGDNLFRTDIKEAEKLLSSMMVYADEVKVRRSLPSTLTITVKQAVPKYSMLQNGSYFTVSESGRILEAGLSSPAEGLMVVKGFDIKDTTPGAALESGDNLKKKILTDISDGIERLGFSGINEVDLTDRTDIKLNYRGRIDVRIGSSMDIYYKLNYTKSVIDALTETYGESYEGTLIYHSASSGMSAIAKDSSETVPVTPDNVENILDDEEAPPEDDTGDVPEEGADQ